MAKRENGRMTCHPSGQRTRLSLFSSSRVKNSNTVWMCIHRMRSRRSAAQSVECRRSLLPAPYLFHHRLGDECTCVENTHARSVYYGGGVTANRRVALFTPPMVVHSLPLRPSARAIEHSAARLELKQCGQIVYAKGKADKRERENKMGKRRWQIHRNNKKKKNKENQQRAQQSWHKVYAVSGCVDQSIIFFLPSLPLCAFALGLV